VIQALIDYYRISEDAIGVLTPTEDIAGNKGLSHFATTNATTGQSLSHALEDMVRSVQLAVLGDNRLEDADLPLPFDFSELIENIRLERYRRGMVAGNEVFAGSEPIRRIYYLIRSGLPAPVRRHLQRVYFRNWQKLPFPAWPVDLTVENLHEQFLRLLMEARGVKEVPFIWFWPEGASNCLIMTHDVETSAGRNFSSKLMDLDDSCGIKASFQVIPEKRYTVSDQYVREIRNRGFEFNIHDLNHDGHLYREREEFVLRAAKINAYVRQYGSQGFRAGAMYRNQEWYDLFEFSYDMSVPNVAHLEPMRGGCCTIMPYFIGNILELPLTTVQDYSLFHILNDYSTDIWKQQLNIIRKRNGLMSFIAHPDYLIEKRARRVYESLLDHLRQRIADENIWHALPGEVDQWWRARSQMRLVNRNGKWSIEGPQSERARVAYATTEEGSLVLKLKSESAEAEIQPTVRPSL